MIALPWLWACAKTTLPTPGREPVTWDVAVAVASGDRQLEALYTLATEPAGRGVWRIATVRTSGRWQDAGRAEEFDSSTPTATDPWPLTLQHLVAAVPALVRMKDGQAVELVDPDDWAERAREALRDGGLPDEAAATGDPLVDPDGLLHDLQRTFPGLPPEGPWERAEKIAGVEARRIETCTSSVAAEERTWDCRGRAEADGPARFHEVDTWTRMAADRAGLRWMESGYSGTLVLLAPGGQGVVDRPIAGLRRVERR